ncbi:heterokaryon incompatibility protein-domain-containing protein [Daldinia decipiens]|uniref:heterokaryon incompatibility protein-domain-containing protein n=1 Tax=Daldinia decipiens TaxID=326647 RepID=UPI0020C59CE4|nr:heterokaryon incompatibility protein-domain-containing protein [Daldinia decipiens]KAI1656085.1 heterokaryon incompatibility protein-domain-containing protein [Daldinia decipiens]
MLSKTEIRILDLLPSSGLNNSDAPIQCQTRVVPFPTDIEFETLSYVWGTVQDVTNISVDGNDVPITTNLAAVLRRVRLSDKIRTVWVDQLCINQQDEEEKAKQVSLMGRIYSTTSQCLIWLGEIGQDISLSDAQIALDFLHYLSEGRRKQEGTSELSASVDFDSVEALREPMRALYTIGLKNNPWWARMWTLQEAILPPKACVLWGELSIQWEVLVSAAARWVSLPYDPVMYAYNDALYNILSQVRGFVFAKENRQGPLDTAFRWSFRNASNPLDKVYGFIGLFPPGTLPRVRSCDYGLSRATLYAMFTADLIECQKSLHPIALRCLRNLPESTPDIPRWALDMGVSHIQFSMTVDGNDCAWYLMSTYDCYNACGETTIDWSRFRYDQISNTLELTGYMVDSIVVAGPGPRSRIDEPDTSNVSRAGVVRLIQDWYGIAEEFYKSQPRHESTYDTNSFPDSFWKGLVGNIKVDPELFPEGEATSEDIALAKKFVQTGIKNEIYESIFGNIAHRQMIITKTGLLGFGPNHAEVGDQVWILSGGKMPFVLRPSEGQSLSTNELLFIGSSYIDGIMEGEAIELDKPATDIVLR